MKGIYLLTQPRQTLYQWGWFAGDVSLPEPLLFLQPLKELTAAVGAVGGGAAWGGGAEAWRIPEELLELLECCGPTWREPDLQKWSPSRVVPIPCVLLTSPG